MEGAREPGGLNIDGLDNPECVTCTSDKLESTGSEPVCVLAGAGGIVVDEIPLLLNPIGGLVRKCLCMLNLRVNLRTSIKVENLLRGLGGTNLSPLSRTDFSASVRVAELKLKIPFPFMFFFFWDCALLPPLDPLFFLYIPDVPPWFSENPKSN